MKFVLIVAALVLAGCGASAPKAAEPKAAETAAPFTLASVFPEGAGRDKVMNACGSCHSVICVTRGQRTAEQWGSIQKSHRDKLADTTPADLDGMFTYLTANFNDKKPEPKVPAELAQQGCTPF